MSIISFEHLKGLTGFRDIKFILEQACRLAIDVHPNFSRDKKCYDFEKRENDPYNRLYTDGNVVKVFFVDRKTCGNFETTYRWEKNGDTLMYLNIFEIDNDEDRIELTQISRYQIKVNKKVNDNCAEKVYITSGRDPKPTKKKSKNIKGYLFTAAISAGGIYLAKKQFWDGGLFSSVTDTIENTFGRVSDSLNLTK